MSGLRMNRPGNRVGRVGTLEERFWRKVRKTKTCWLWTACQNGTGYGEMNIGAGRAEAGLKALAHRMSYEMCIGKIPKGLTIDHLCRNTLCVRPSHLEAVTLRENILRGTGFAAVNSRKTHCSKGHSYTGENLFVNVRGDRGCRICENANQRKYRRGTNERRRTKVLR